MSLRHVPNPEPFIACVLAAADAQDRLRLAYSRDDAARQRDLTLDELMSARELSIRYGYSVSEAADIVRRSRR